MGQIAERQSETQERIERLREVLGNAADLLDTNACVYMTGSFGRLESNENSDLDLFILASDKYNDEGRHIGGRLSSLDAICVKAELVNAAQSLGIPKFDGDGRYLLKHYSVGELTKTLGMPEDDSTNTFTARLLLLLESHCLLGQQVYDLAIKDVIAAYFKDFPDHSTNFKPAFLGNDILRLWRTFCVNYEARTQAATLEKKAKRKVKNYKLKHSRLMTCFSSLLYLLAVDRVRGTVAPSDVIAMVQLTPVGRIQKLIKTNELASSHSILESLLAQYENYLQTAVDESALMAKLDDRREGNDYKERTYKFGDTVFDAMHSIGRDDRLLRLLVV